MKSDKISKKKHAEIQNMRDGAKGLQKRRHTEWQENYRLYRNKVEKNRVTQRQSVSIPLMKETIQTTLSKTDEAPDIYFESLSGDKQKEIFLNEYWNKSKDDDAFVIKDTVDKKMAYLYGRSGMKLNIYNGQIHTEVLEPIDILIGDNADPADIDNTAMYVAHRNIFQTLDQVLSNETYTDESSLKELKDHFHKNSGDSDRNYEAMLSRKDRLSDLGWSISIESGQKLVRLTEHYVKEWNEDMQDFEVMYCVEAEDKYPLVYKPLKEVLGVNFFPIETWATDTERTDIWSDGIGDIARTPNKIVNAWFSQLVENRTMKNLGMTMYNSSENKDFSPNSFTPRPWGWYPIPGNPNELTRPIDIPDLSGSLDEMGFVINSLERATASTAILKGQSESGQQTLGEVMELVKSSTERVTSLTKYYRESRRRLGEKWYKLAMNNKDKLEPIKVYKKSAKDNMYSQEIKHDDWMDEEGYECKVTSKAESTQKTVQEIKKLQLMAQEFAGNRPLQKILKKRLLDLGEFSAEEIEEVMGYEEQKQEMQDVNPENLAMAPRGPQGGGQAPQAPNPQGAERMQELAAQAMPEVAVEGMTN